MAKPGVNLYELSRAIAALTGAHSTGKKPFTVEEMTILVKEYKNRMTGVRSVNSRIMECIDVLHAYAHLEFGKKVRLNKTNDHLNALALGINMLGEELQNSVLSLREKEMLLKEIHHRVKNNLQIISSLLSLNSFSDPQTEAIFHDARIRIKSIALVHEHLYGSSRLTEISTKTYTPGLVQQIRQLFDPKGRVSIKMEMDDILLNLDQAVPTGLILNELLTNAYKYAARSHSKPVIQLKIKRKQKRMVIVVTDNGPGFPGKFTLRNSQSLGLHLVEMLAGQMDGKLMLRKPANGATAEVDVLLP